jgi:hypothetical protein
MRTPSLELERLTKRQMTNGFAQKVPRVSILTCDRKHFSRKGAKAQRKTLKNAAAPCVFAPLREKPSRIKQFLCKAMTNEKCQMNNVK